MRATIILLFAILLLFVAVWTLLPAPTAWLLPLSVGAPEIGAPLALTAAVVATISLLDVRKIYRARVALLLSLIAIAFALLPLVQFYSTSRDATRELEAVMSPGFLQSLSASNPELAGSTLDIPQVFMPLSETKSLSTGRSVSFRVVDGDTLQMMVYQRDPTHLQPVLIQIYGGAWQRGNPSDFSGFARRAADLGFVVFRNRLSTCAKQYFSGADRRRSCGTCVCRSSRERVRC